jgi:sodium-coupled neutral amino acid transporter 11
MQLNKTCYQVIQTVFFKEKELSDFWHYLVSVLLALTVMSLAMASDNLGVVLEFNGIINATLIAFIIPVCAGFV